MSGTAPYRATLLPPPPPPPRPSWWRALLCRLGLHGPRAYRCEGPICDWRVECGSCGWWRFEDDGPHG